MNLTKCDVQEICERGYNFKPVNIERSVGNATAVFTSAAGVAFDRVWLFDEQGFIAGNPSQTNADVLFIGDVCLRVKGLNYVFAAGNVALAELQQVLSKTNTSDPTAFLFQPDELFLYGDGTVGFDNYAPAQITLPYPNQKATAQANVDFPLMRFNDFKHNYLFGTHLRVALDTEAAGDSISLEVFAKFNGYKIFVV